MHAHAVDGLARISPCAHATAGFDAPAGSGSAAARTVPHGGVCVEVLHPEQFTIVAADGSPLVLQPPGPPIVPVDTP